MPVVMSRLRGSRELSSRGKKAEGKDENGTGGHRGFKEQCSLRKTWRRRIPIDFIQIGGPGGKFSTIALPIPAQLSLSLGEKWRLAKFLDCARIDTAAREAKRRPFVSSLEMRLCRRGFS